MLFRSGPRTGPRRSLPPRPCQKGPWCSAGPRSPRTATPSTARSPSRSGHRPPATWPTMPFEEPVATGIGPVRWILTGTAMLSVVVIVAGIGLNRPRLVEASFPIGVVTTVGAALFAALDRNARGWEGLRDWGEWVDGWLSWRGLLLAVGVLVAAGAVASVRAARRLPALVAGVLRSEEPTSELQSLMRSSYAVFWL